MIEEGFASRFEIVGEIKFPYLFSFFCTMGMSINEFERIFFA